MYFNNLSLLTKLIAAFGITIACALIALSISYTQLNTVQSTSNSSVTLNSLSHEMMQREIDHLKWAADISLYILDDSIDLLEIQTDPKACGFGKWYYGSDAEEARALLPSIVKSLDDIEEYHNALHASAIAIAEQYDPEDTSQALMIYQTETIPALNRVQKLLGEITTSVGQATQEISQKTLSSITQTKKLIIL